MKCSYRRFAITIISDENNSDDDDAAEGVGKQYTQEFGCNGIDDLRDIVYLLQSMNQNVWLKNVWPNRTKIKSKDLLYRNHLPDHLNKFMSLSMSHVRIKCCKFESL